MNKILVRIYVPVMGKQYDVKLPLNRKIGNTIVLLLKGINELSLANYEPEIAPALYNKNTGISYDYQAVIKDTDIKNGTELILI